MALSSLQQVINELSLDFANGKYLNVISANYGLNRPLFGFSDDLWRAVTKVVALQYKQITNKFIDILELVLGPRVSIGTGLAETARPDDVVLKVHDASRFPQVGTLILDKGTGIEETIVYRFIDYENNTIFLTSPLIYSHNTVDQDAEVLVLWAPNGESKILLETSEPFSAPTNPYVVNVGRGTAFEETCQIIGRSVSTKTLTTFSPLVNDHEAIVLNLEKSELSEDYTKGAFYIKVNDADSFPDQGVLLINTSVNSFTAGGGSTNTNIVVNASVFTEINSLSGYKVHFDGNMTASLANYETFIIGNTNNSFTIMGPSPANPAAGDTFYIFPVVQFTGKSEGVLNLKYVIQPDLVVPAGSVVESYKYFPTAQTSTVLVPGIAWDVFQSRPNLVEIIIPFDDSQLQNPLSASYVHTEAVGASTTTSGASLTGDVVLNVTNGASFPESGQLVIDSGGLSEERAGYAKISQNQFHIPYGLDLPHAGSETVDYDDFVYAGTDTLVGDIHNYNYVFPGPYVYDPDSRAQTLTPTLLGQNLASSTKLSLDVTAGAGPKAIEIEDANLFPLTGTFTAKLESEDITVSRVSLKSRVQATLNGSHSASDTTLLVTAGTLAPAVDGALFPNANGYRVKIGRGTANVEICYVLSINTGTNIITIETGLQQSHASGSLVELISDVLTISQLDSSHTGIVALSERVPINTTEIPEAEISNFNYSGASIVSLPYSTIDVVSGVDFAPDGGTALVSFGDIGPTRIDTLASDVSQGDIVVPLVNSDDFPTVYPYFVKIDPGTRFEEVLEIIDNDTTTDELTVFNSTVHGPLRYDHEAGCVVMYIGDIVEEIEYESCTGNTLTLAEPFVVQYPHQINNDICNSRINTPPNNGEGYAFRVPVDYFERLQYLLDLVRAAGVQVQFIRNL